MYAVDPYEHMTIEIKIKDGEQVVAKCSATDNCIHDLQVHTDYQNGTQSSTINYLFEDLNETIDKAKGHKDENAICAP